jgi:HEAT repeat protein
MTPAPFASGNASPAAWDGYRPKSADADRFCGWAVDVGGTASEDDEVPELPPEDRPDEIWIGGVGPIPIRYEDDPRLAEDREAWSKSTARAQAMHSADELLAGLVDADWRVRHEIVDRLIARARDDRRTLPALLKALAHDPAWQVRDAVAIRMADFERDAVLPALLTARADPHPEVRWSVEFSISQLVGPPPAAR